MSASPASTPSQPGLSSLRRERKIATVCAFILGLSVFLSFEWWETPPSFRSDAFDMIALGVVLVVLILLVTFVVRFLRVLGPAWNRRRFCPRCGRQIPFDALVCPYCAHQLP
jgi:apolipoprotein N-acyltransferase